MNGVCEFNWIRISWQHSESGNLSPFYTDCFHRYSWATESKCDTSRFNYSCSTFRTSKNSRPNWSQFEEKLMKVIYIRFSGYMIAVDKWSICMLLILRFYKFFRYTYQSHPIKSHRSMVQTFEFSLVDNTIYATPVHHFDIVDVMV